MKAEVERELTRVVEPSGLPRPETQGLREMDRGAAEEHRQDPVSRFPEKARRVFSNVYLAFRVVQGAFRSDYSVFGRLK